MNGGNTILGYKATLSLDVDGTKLVLNMPFLYDDDAIKLDMPRILELIHHVQRDQRMRTNLAGVKTADGRVYAPEDVELIYEGGN